MNTHPRRPDWADRLRALEGQVTRLVRRDNSPARETIAARIATATWATTTSLSYTDLVYLTHLQARDALTVQVWAAVSGGGSADLQLWDFDNNLELAAASTTSPTQTQIGFLDVPYRGVAGDRRDIRVRGRTTAGTLSVLPIYAYSASPPG